MSKSVMIIDTPIDCCDCPFGTMAFGKSICLLDEGNGIDCPLKPYKDFIPIEWILKYRFNNRGEITYYSIDAIDHMLSEWCEAGNIDMWDMIDKWEKENETAGEN